MRTMHNILPDKVADLPEVFQRMYMNAPGEIVPLAWVASQAGYKNVGSIHNKICKGVGPKSFISGKRRCCDRLDAVLWIAEQVHSELQGV